MLSGGFVDRLRNHGFHIILDQFSESSRSSMETQLLHEPEMKTGSQRSAKINEPSYFPIFFPKLYTFGVVLYLSMRLFVCLFVCESVYLPSLVKSKLTTSSGWSCCHFLSVPLIVPVALHKAVAEVSE